MPLTLRYLGWTAFELILEDRRRVILDPLLVGRAEDDVPPGPCKLEEFDGVDVVMVTHVAPDHIGQALDILKRSRAKLVCDVSTRFKALAAGIEPERIFFMVTGVQFNLDGLLVKALPAVHLSFSQLAENSFINSPALSYLITTPGGTKIFFGGDTSISKDHQLFGELYRPDIAILGVGGVEMHGQSCTELYPNEAALVAKWLGVKLAFPMHYRFNEGEEFARELKGQAPETRAVLLQPGEVYQYTQQAR